MRLEWRPWTLRHETPFSSARKMRMLKTKRISDSGRDTDTGAIGRTWLQQQSVPDAETQRFRNMQPTQLPMRGFGRLVLPDPDPPPSLDGSRNEMMFGDVGWDCFLTSPNPANFHPAPDWMLEILNVPSCPNQGPSGVQDWNSASRGPAENASWQPPIMDSSPCGYQSWESSCEVVRSDDEATSQDSVGSGTGTMGSNAAIMNSFHIQQRRATRQKEDYSHNGIRRQRTHQPSRSQFICRACQRSFRRKCDLT
jgi:hypothetical protein